MFKELEEIGPDKIQIAKRRPDFGRYIDKDWHHHFLLYVYAIDGIRVENEERLAVALALAVHQIAPSLPSEENRRRFRELSLFCR